MFSELKNRGVADVPISVCEGPKGFPDAIIATWETHPVQTCVVHRNSLSCAGRQHCDAIATLKPVCTAPSTASAKERCAELAATWSTSTEGPVQLTNCSTRSYP